MRTDSAAHLATLDALFRKDALQFEGSRLERVRLCFDLYSDVRNSPAERSYKRDCSERSNCMRLVRGGEGLGWRKACKWLRVVVKIKVGGS